MKRDQVLGIRIWPIILAACGLAAIPYTLAGFRFGSLAFLIVPLVGVLSARLLMRYSETYQFGALVDGAFQMTFVSLFGIMSCYAAAASNMPLIDAELIHFDQAIGYNWLSYAQFVRDNPILHQALHFSYPTCFVQPIIVVFILYLTNRQAKYEKFILSMLIGLTFTALIFIACPATTAWTYLNQEALASSALTEMPVSSKDWIANLLEVRAGGGRLVSSPAGLIAFPSFHCVMAVLNVRAMSSTRWLRLPFLILNGLMIASAPLIGGHYAADLIGGGLVALAAAILGEKAHRWLSGAHFSIKKSWNPEPVTLRAQI